MTKRLCALLLAAFLAAGTATRDSAQGDNTEGIN